MLANDWELEAQAEEYGMSLARQVTQGSLAAGDLRAGVCWANALDREVVALSSTSAETLGQADHLEATARRIAHHAGRYALGKVGSRKRLENTIARARTAARG